MTKKDYIKIADILKDYQDLLPEYKNHQAIITELTNRFIVMLEADNPRFNRERFIDYINKQECQECGYIKHRYNCTKFRG